MKVLVACEFSGVVRNAFRELGHIAYSCDILPADDSQDYHLQCSVLDVFDGYKGFKWDLMIAHPPCTYITNAGVRHLHSVPSRNGVITKNHGEERWRLLYEACDFFNKLQNCDIPRICVENPIPHKYAREKIGKYTQIIQPWQFGHGETKATCLWLKNLPLLQPTNVVVGRESRIYKMGPSKDRAKLRSITFEGIGKAMAQQWRCL